MQRNFLEQFLEKLKNFPQWVKEIIYAQLSQEFSADSSYVMLFTQYRPTLTYKGKCELDYKKSNFDTNIYNVLNSCDKNLSVAEIVLNTYMSMEEIASYIILCTDEGYIQPPEDLKILNIAGYLAGKYKTGEYFLKNGSITQNQLDKALSDYKSNKTDEKFGQTLKKLGMVDEKHLNKILTFKEESKQRFILDFNQIPQIKQEYTGIENRYKKQIEDLKQENKQLQRKLNQLLIMVKNNE